VKHFVVLRIGPEPHVYRASCQTCRYVGPPRLIKKEAKVDARHHRRARHDDGPLDPRDER